MTETRPLVCKFCKIIRDKAEQKWKRVRSLFSMGLISVADALISASSVFSSELDPKCYRQKPSSQPTPEESHWLAALREGMWLETHKDAAAA